MYNRGPILPGDKDYEYHQSFFENEVVLKEQARIKYRDLEEKYRKTLEESEGKPELKIRKSGKISEQPDIWPQLFKTDLKEFFYLKKQALVLIEKEGELWIEGIDYRPRKEKKTRKRELK